MSNFENIKYFKELLYENINEEQIARESNNTCLISGNNLTNNYIKLVCGHKYNYKELYNEVLYQKTKKILDNRKLKINEIKCPYCRQISNFLLPYYKYYNVKDVYGVTNPTKYCIKINECQYINNNQIKCKNSACYTSKGLFCNKHLKLSLNEEECINNISQIELNKYKKYKIIELKKFLRENKLKLCGNKDELIIRLLINKINIE